MMRQRVASQRKAAGHRPCDNKPSNNHGHLEPAGQVQWIHGLAKGDVRNRLSWREPPKPWAPPLSLTNAGANLHGAHGQLPVARTTITGKEKTVDKAATDIFRFATNITRWSPRGQVGFPASRFGIATHVGNSAGRDLKYRREQRVAPNAATGLAYKSSTFCLRKDREERTQSITKEGGSGDFEEGLAIPALH
jgi:hypothetical protein